MNIRILIVLMLTVFSGKVMAQNVAIKTNLLYGAYTYTPILGSRLGWASVVLDMDNIKVQMVNIPKSSYLLDAHGNSTNPGTDFTETSENNNSESLFWSFYTLENFDKSPASATYLKIAVPYRYTGESSFGRMTYYQIYIPETSGSSDIAKPYTIKRNTWYSLTVSILGKGDSSPTTYSLPKTSSPSIRITNLEVEPY